MRSANPVKFMVIIVDDGLYFYCQWLSGAKRDSLTPPNTGGTDIGQRFAQKMKCESNNWSNQNRMKKVP